MEKGALYPETGPWHIYTPLPLLRKFSYARRYINTRFVSLFEKKNHYLCTWIFWIGYLEFISRTILRTTDIKYMDNPLELVNTHGYFGEVYYTMFFLVINLLHCIIVKQNVDLPTIWFQCLPSCR